MITITFNAFSFLQAKLKKNQTPHINAALTLPKDMCIEKLVQHLGLAKEDVEGAFVNNRIVSMVTVLQNGDRVALVPPGTPGPYRVMLGMVPLGKKEADSDTK
jgi:molybdopterin converting factor small subunit